MYKVEAYLRPCIESIINQTYQNLEIILVDDGSPDQCGSICDEYAQKDRRVRVIHKANGGLSDARNAGLDIATGEYIGFVDSDDYLEPNMYEVLYQTITARDVDLCICNFLRVDTRGNEVIAENRWLSSSDEFIDGHTAMARLVTNTNGYWSIAWNKIYRRKLWEKLRFPKGKIHEDEFIMHRIFDRCMGIACIAQPLYCYRVAPDSIMTSKYSMKRLDVVEAMFDRILFYHEKKYYQLAAETNHQAFALLLTAYSKLDMKDKQAKKGYFERKKKCQEIYFKTKSTFHESLKRKVQKEVFFMIPHIYVWTWKFYSFVKY